VKRCLRTGTTRAVLPGGADWLETEEMREGEHVRLIDRPRALILDPT
jgi:hypothetical protein